MTQRDGSEELWVMDHRATHNDPLAEPRARVDQKHGDRPFGQTKTTELDGTPQPVAAVFPRPMSQLLECPVEAVRMPECLGSHSRQRHLNFLI